MNTNVEKAQHMLSGVSSMQTRGAMTKVTRHLWDGIIQADDEDGPPN